MTKQELDDIFDEIDRGEYDPSSQEVIMLLEEIQCLKVKWSVVFLEKVLKVMKLDLKTLK